jgi:hypothetical protein
MVAIIIATIAITAITAPDRQRIEALSLLARCGKNMGASARPFRAERIRIASAINGREL